MSGAKSPNSNESIRSGAFGGLLRGATFVFFCRVSGAALAFGSQIVLARWMGAEQMGVYVFAFSVCVLLTTVSGLGLPTAAVRFIGSALAQDRGDLVLGYARRTFQIIGLVGVVVAAIGGLLLSTDLIVTGDGYAALLIALIMVPVYGQLTARSGVAMGLSWFRMAFLPNTVIRPLIFLILVAGAWQFAFGLNAQSAMLLQFAAIALMAIVQWLLLGRGLQLRFPDANMAFETPSWIRTALPLLVVTLSVNYFLELNVFVAGNFLESRDLAIYNASVRTSGLVAFGLIAVDAISAPRFSGFHAAADRFALQSIVSHAARLRFAGAVIGLSVFVLVGRWVLALFGEEFVAGYRALIILSAAYAAAATFGPAARVLSVTGLQDLCLPVFVASVLAIVALYPVLIPDFGINGAAWVAFAVIVLQAICLNVIVIRRLGINAWIFSPGKISG